MAYTLKIINGKRVWVSDTVAPAPPPPKVTTHSRLPGGLPPVPYRNACSKWGGCRTVYAREPFQSRQIRAEILGDRASNFW